MVRTQDVHQVLGKLGCMLRIAVGDMRHEINEVLNGHNAIVSRGGWRLQKYLSLMFILAVLAKKIFFI